MADGAWLPKDRYLPTHTRLTIVRALAASVPNQLCLNKPRDETLPLLASRQEKERKIELHYPTSLNVGLFSYKYIMNSKVCLRNFSSFLFSLRMPHREAVSKLDSPKFDSRFLTVWLL